MDGGRDSIFFSPQSCRAAGAAGFQVHTSSNWLPLPGPVIIITNVLVIINVFTNIKIVITATHILVIVIVITNTTIVITIFITIAKGLI